MLVGVSEDKINLWVFAITWKFFLFVDIKAVFDSSLLYYVMFELCSLVKIFPCESNNKQQVSEFYAFTLM